MKKLEQGVLVGEVFLFLFPRENASFPKKARLNEILRSCNLYLRTQGAT